MQFDHNTLQTLLAMDDASLWQVICTIASRNGITLPRTTPPHEVLASLRAAVSTKGQADIGEALRIINDYRKEH